MDQQREAKGQIFFTEDDVRNVQYIKFDTTGKAIFSVLQVNCSPPAFCFEHLSPPHQNIKSLYNNKHLQLQCFDVENVWEKMTKMLDANKND